MTQEISIWRWAVTDDLEALFAQLVGADEAGFQAVANQIMQAGEGSAPQPSLAQLEVDTEAKMRASGVPKDILDTMLKGLRDMMAEAREEQEASQVEEEDDFAPDADGREEVALASSHMFFDDPYAGLPYDEIDKQVADLMDAYRSAASKVLGQQGQSLFDHLGVTADQFYDNPASDHWEEQGLGAIEWIWVTPAHVYTLSQWREDKELPIDLAFGRMTAEVFQTFTSKI